MGLNMDFFIFSIFFFSFTPPTWGTGTPDRHWSLGACKGGGVGGVYSTVDHGSCAVHALLFVVEIVKKLCLY